MLTSEVEPKVPSDSSVVMAAGRAASDPSNESTVVLADVLLEDDESDPSNEATMVSGVLLDEPTIVLLEFDESVALDRFKYSVCDTPH